MLSFYIVLLRNLSVSVCIYWHCISCI